MISATALISPIDTKANPIKQVINDALTGSFDTPLPTLNHFDIFSGNTPSTANA